MEKYLLKTNRICSFCKEAQIVEKFTLVQNRQHLDMNSQPFGVTIPDLGNHIKSYGHHCQNCDIKIEQDSILKRMSQKKQDKALEMIRKALLCSPYTLKKDTMVHVESKFSQREASVIFTKGKLVYGYTEYPKSFQPRRLVDAVNDEGVSFIAEKPEGPFFRVFSDIELSIHRSIEKNLKLKKPALKA